MTSRWPPRAFSPRSRLQPVGEWLPESDEPLPELSEVRTPEYHMSDDDVEGLDIEYSTRAPEDWVISGPLPNGGGPGRVMPNVKAAAKFVSEKYGDCVKGRIPEATKNNGNRWAYLIDGKRWSERNKGENK